MFAFSARKNLAITQRNGKFPDLCDGIMHRRRLRWHGKKIKFRWGHPMVRREEVHVQVDDTTIAGDNVGAIMHPVWWLATIYDGPVAYEESLKQFSRSQRLVFAMLWYIAEVNNGGHRQFYSNSAGIVWCDAIAGFEAIGEPKGARIVAISADRLGGSPSSDREERNEQLDSVDPDFDDLDEAFAELQKRVNLDQQIMTFIRARPADFYFSGTIERVVIAVQ
jgi:Domain of unknown function (DUF4375)